jgi:hypothetical protein
LTQIAQEQMNGLTAAIEAHDFLRRVRDGVEHQHRVVFHGNERADWSLVRRSADQILIAEIMNRHRGQIDGVYFALRKLENDGRTWDAAIQELAEQIHSYYTTPLGIVMRQNLFGSAVVFITPDALDWTDQLRRREAAG